MTEPPIGERRPPQFTLLNLTAVIAVVAIALILLLPWLHARREAARRALCTNFLHGVGLAVLNYHARSGVFPPVQIVDEYGSPMHGWRIHTTPYLDRDDCYRAYAFDQSWNGPRNRALHGIRICGLTCPSDPSRPGPYTSYVAVIGDATAWPRGKNRRGIDFRNGASNSLLVVEVSKSGIHWLEPRDLEFDSFDYAINSGSGRGICSEHAGGANVLYADGAVGWLSQSTSPGVLRALLRIAGGEEMPEDY